jgi:hypothetical protein
MLVLALLILIVIVFGPAVRKFWVTLLKFAQMPLHKTKMALIRYVFRGSSGSVALKLVRKFNMEKTALKHLIYGSLEEIIRDRHYYHHSTVGESYSHFTEEGKEAVQEFMGTMAYKIRAAEEADLERRAREQTMAALKA